MQTAYAFPPDLASGICDTHVSVPSIISHQQFTSLVVPPRPDILFISVPFISFYVFTLFDTMKIGLLKENSWCDQMRKECAVLSTSNASASVLMGVKESYEQKLPLLFILSN